VGELSRRSAAVLDRLGLKRRLKALIRARAQATVL
jgi:hypothetical protein